MKVQKAEMDLFQLGWSAPSSLGGYSVSSKGYEGARMGEAGKKEHVCRTSLYLLEH